MIIHASSINEFNIPWGIVTNKPKFYAKRIVDTFLSQYEPKFLVCPDDTGERKPSPKGLLMACKLVEALPQNSIYVEALDYSKTAIKNITNKAEKLNLTKLIKPKLFDVRKKLPFENNFIEGCFSHMLYCMALISSELEDLNKEIYRILKPGGINIYTVRHTEDGDYKNGIHRGENLYENDGFIIHFFSKDKVNQLSKGFEILDIEKFEEGKFPRKLFFVKNRKI